MAKLWGGRFSKNTNELVDAFNASIEFDKRLYHEDIRGSIAHAQMLGKCGIITAEDVEKIFGKRPWTSRSEEIMASEEASKQKEEKQEKEETPVSTSENEAKDPEVKELPEPTEDKTTLNS